MSEDESKLQVVAESVSLTVVNALGVLHHFRYGEVVGERDVVAGG
jgi:hypothetical protein